MPKPKVSLKCPANAGTPHNERIVEFSHLGAGGLISFFRPNEDEPLRVCIYQADNVEAQVGMDVPYWLPLDSPCVGTAPYVPILPSHEEHVVGLLTKLIVACGPRLDVLLESAKRRVAGEE